MSRPLFVSFIGNRTGSWRVRRMNAVVGDSLPAVERLDMIEGPAIVAPREAAWVLRGVTSNLRYTNGDERDVLLQRQQALARPEATLAALIPIRKTEAWWELAQDRRREILEQQSRHIQIGLEYLPAVARRLHHSRELGEPFDFLTWFEYAPEHNEAFEELVGRLRETSEWQFVDREIDIRLSRS